MEIKKPYLLFLGDVHDQLAAKTAQGVVDWRPDWCTGQLRLAGCKADCQLSEMTVTEAAAQGAKTMIVGVANSGGFLPAHWIEKIIEALDAGLDVATGLHTRLASIPAIAEAATRNNCELHDIRYPGMTFATATGKKRTGRRLLAVGTDCSAGKKYTSLAMEREMRARGMDVDFRATGQTGVLISGRGVALDAVIADFISGAAEWLSPDNKPHHWDVIEGQGSLFHPAFAGVTLGLMHGSQPDAFIVCHEPTRTRMRAIDYPLPSIGDVIERTIVEGRLTNPDICCTGIAINTMALDEPAARRLLDDTAAQYGVACCDPVRTGCGPLVDELITRFPA